MDRRAPRRLVWLVLLLAGAWSIGGPPVAAPAQESPPATGQPAGKQAPAAKDAPAEKPAPAEEQAPAGKQAPSGQAADGQKKADEEDYYELYKVLVDTLDQVDRNYVKEVDRRQLVEAAIRGIIGQLDPYSAYISPEELSRFRRSVEAEFGGIGIQVGMEDGELMIVSPMVGTPGYRAGLMAGDRIVEIEGRSTEGLSLDEAVKELQGAEGTKITLSVIHPGSTGKERIELVRERIHVETVLGDRRKADDTWDFMLDAEQHVGYIRVSSFTRDTAEKIRQAVEELQAQNLQGLILDLRFNPGGLLSSAIEVADLFVDKGRIVSTEGRNSPERAWNARREGTFTGFPMVVLVNRYSASASEIVAACLQDHKRAVIVGERTWGKGSVQNVIELEGGRSALKLTTAAYRRPSGKNIHRFEGAQESDEWGVTPDEGFALRLGEGEIAGLMRDRRQRDVVRPHTEAVTGLGDDHAAEPETAAGEGPGKPAEPARSAQVASAGSQGPTFVDRQLRIAVEYLTDRLAKAR